MIAPHENIEIMINKIAKNLISFVLIISISSLTIDSKVINNLPPLFVSSFLGVLLIIEAGKFFPFEIHFGTPLTWGSGKIWLSAVNGNSKI